MPLSGSKNASQCNVPQPVWSVLFLPIQLSSALITVPLGSLSNENARAGAEPAYILKNPGGFFNNTKKSYICKSITTGTTLKCKSAKDLKLTANDVAVVLFTDVDFRSNLAKVQRGEDITIDTSGNLHDSSYGVIVAKL